MVLTEGRLLGATRCRTAAAIVAAVLAATLAPARAGSATVARDHTDNSFSFSYRARSGRIVTATSSVTIDRRRAVDFFVSVSERKPKRAEDGRGRLRARLELHMTPRAPHVVRYRGEFRLRIVGDKGRIAHADQRDRRIVLRDRSGDRSARLFFAFDVPSGDYSAAGIFRRMPRPG